VVDLVGADLSSDGSGRREFTEVMASDLESLARYRRHPVVLALGNVQYEVGRPTLGGPDIWPFGPVVDVDDSDNLERQVELPQLLGSPSADRDHQPIGSVGAGGRLDAYTVAVDLPAEDFLGPPDDCAVALGQAQMCPDPHLRSHVAGFTFVGGDHARAQTEACKSLAQLLLVEHLAGALRRI